MAGSFGMIVTARRYDNHKVTRADDILIIFTIARIARGPGAHYCAKTLQRTIRIGVSNHELPFVGAETEITRFAPGSALDQVLRAGIRHDMNAALRHGQIAGREPRIHQGIHTRCIQQMHRLSLASLAQSTRRGIVPPEPEGAAHQARVERADSPAEERIDQSASDRARAINPGETLAPPQK